MVCKFLEQKESSCAESGVPVQSRDRAQQVAIVLRCKTRHPSHRNDRSDLLPEPGVEATLAQDHQYNRHGLLSCVCRD
jgi:hypothetical protein